MSLDTFNPVKLSIQENEFLLEHLGEPSSVAIRAIKAAPLPNPARDPKTGMIIDRNPVYYPDGVIPASVKPVLDRVYELLDLEKNFHQAWIGVEAIKDCIKVYLAQQRKWQADKDRFPSAPRFPSMHSYDARNRPHRGGPNSDCGEVSTYFDKDGVRHPFAIDLFENKETGGWAPDWISREKKLALDVKGIIDDSANHRIECPICNHTESYKEDSKSSFNAARARMSRHLKKDTKEVTLHRELYTNEFGS